MADLLNILLLKDRVNGDRDNIFLILFEKAFILIALLVVLLIGIALELPPWAVGVLVGGSLGPIVYGHYYVIYIRPLKKEQNLDEATQQAKRKRM
ncbi:MAG: hypothetical protein ACO20Y_02985 [Poseidonia sp.]|jgi:hypothetical protein